MFFKFPFSCIFYAVLRLLFVTTKVSTSSSVLLKDPYFKEPVDLIYCASWKVMLL